MQGKKGTRETLCALAIAAGAGFAAGAVHADELQDLKSQMEILQKAIADLAAKQQAAEKKQTAPPDAVTAGATKGSFKLPGSDTSVTLGGYVKLDAVYTNPSTGVNSKADLLLDPTTIPVGPNAGDNERSQVKFGARESRLFVKTSTPTTMGDLNTHVEFDFYGADGNESVSNSSGFRVRHAYGTLGNFLAGQTWTNFMNRSSLPETLDFGGPVGQIFDRQAQVRWTQAFGGNGTRAKGQWSVALENPESVLQVPGGATFRADDDRYPDLTGQVRFDTGAGKISLHGLLRQVRIDSGANPAATSEKWGGAISVAGVMPTVGKDDFRFTASAGSAIGRYSNGFFPDGVLSAGGQVQLPRQWGWFAAYRHYWFDRLRSNLVLSMAGEKNPAGSPAATNKSTASSHINLIWSPVANADVGLEYIYANRETEDGAKGHIDRLQASAKYAF